MKRKSQEEEEKQKKEENKEENFSDAYKKDFMNTDNKTKKKEEKDKNDKGITKKKRPKINNITPSGASLTESFESLSNRQISIRKLVEMKIREQTLLKLALEKYVASYLLDVNNAEKDFKEIDKLEKEIHNLYGSMKEEDKFQWINFVENMSVPVKSLLSEIKNDKLKFDKDLKERIEKSSRDIEILNKEIKEKDKMLAEMRNQIETMSGMMESKEVDTKKFIENLHKDFDEKLSNLNEQTNGITELISNWWNAIETQNKLSDSEIENKKIFLENAKNFASMDITDKLELAKRGIEGAFSSNQKNSIDTLQFILQINKKSSEILKSFDSSIKQVKLRLPSISASFIEGDYKRIIDVAAMCSAFLESELAKEMFFKYYYTITEKPIGINIFIGVLYKEEETKKK